MERVADISFEIAENPFQEIKKSGLFRAALPI